MTSFTKCVGPHNHSTDVCIEFEHVFNGQQIHCAIQAEVMLERDDCTGGLPNGDTVADGKPMYGTEWQYCSTRLQMHLDSPDDHDLHDSLRRAIDERGRGMFDLAIAVASLRDKLNTYPNPHRGFSREFRMNQSVTLDGWC